MVIYGFLVILDVQAIFNFRFSFFRGARVEVGRNSLFIRIQKSKTTVFSNQPQMIFNSMKFFISYNLYDISKMDFDAR